MFDYAKFQSAALAVLGAIIFAAVTAGAAVGPAQRASAASYQMAATHEGSRLA